MKIVAGINVGGHDTSFAIINFEKNPNGDVTVYETERFTKKKGDGHFPILPLKKAFIEFPEIRKISPKNIGTNSMGLSPDQNEQILEDSVDFIGLIKLFGMENYSSLLNKEIKSYTHHICHAYAALFFSPFEKSIIFVADGRGSDAGPYLNNYEETTDTKFLPPAETTFESLSVYLQDEAKLTLIKKDWVDNNDEMSMGMGSGYGQSATHIFGSWKESGKVMGLAAFGKKTSLGELTKWQQLRKHCKTAKNKIHGKNDFDNQPKDSFQKLADFALLTQEFFEEEMLKNIKEIKTKYPGYKNIIIVGGCALNCLLNTRLVNLGWFEQVFIPPCPNDEGIALGAAYKRALEIGMVKFQPKTFEEMQAYLGSRLILKQLQNESMIKNYFSDFLIEKHQNIVNVVAQLLKNNEIIAWFQGRSEIGPRALGNRSLLCLPNIPGIKDYLNNQVKKREKFRPYGCSVIQESASNYFECPENYPMPFMSFAPKALSDKKEFLREIIHPDGSCRIQTVLKGNNERYHSLLKEVEKLTGHPILLNTSLNIMGQPILETIEDAVTFMKTNEINYMAIGDYLVKRK